jgi:protein TonB
VFSRLPESNARRQRRLGGLAVSSGAHLVIIALAVRATALTATPRPETKAVPTIYIAPDPTPPQPPSPRRPFTNPDPSVPSAPNARDFPTVPNLDNIPNVIPDAGSMANLMEPAFDATRVSASGPPTGASPNVSDGAPLRENMVEKAVVAIPGTATPRYPSLLQSAGVEGDVRAQFVVDTLGRVEHGSVRILETSHDQFSAAVRDALAGARFTPAEAGGHKVRQLVEQTFTFRIEH